jgi:hypothetical protein
MDSRDTIMLIAPTKSPDATASSLLALLELVEDAEVAVALDIEVTLVQLDAAPAGTVALADKVKSAHVILFVSVIIFTGKARLPTW